MQVILFVAACMAWQAIKDGLRGGKKKPTVSLGQKIVKAQCGCGTVGDKVVKPCVPHSLMAEVANGGR